MKTELQWIVRHYSRFVVYVASVRDMLGGGKPAALSLAWIGILEFFSANGTLGVVARSHWFVFRLRTSESKRLNHPAIFK